MNYLTLFMTLSITGSRLSGQELDPKASVQNGATNRANSRIDQGVDKGLDKIESGIGSLFKKKHRKADSATAMRKTDSAANVRRRDSAAAPGRPDSISATGPGDARGQVELQPAGLQLQTFYLSMDVENNWLSGQHVNWETGQPDMPGSAHGNKTHCSAFAAAVCQKLGIYLLRPPEHGQLLLANAQSDWLSTAAAATAGWRRLDGNDRYLQAQTLANNGKIVLCIVKNPDPKVPGHAALVMPKARSLKLLADEGPELIMAGTHNHNYISLRNGFQSHISTWPEQEIRLFVNDL